MKLDKKDRILLTELRRNSRTPLTLLAKKARLSKESTHYRLKRLNKIVKFIAWINYSKIGFKYFQLNVKISKSSPEYSQLIEVLGSSDSVLWISEARVYSESMYNIRAIFIKQSKVEAETFRYSFTKLKTIKDISMQNIGYLTRDSKDLFDQQTIDISERINLNDELQTSTKLDQVDTIIINLLRENSRHSNLEIAKTANVTSATVKARIDKLLNLGVIAKFTTAFDYTQLSGELNHVVMKKKCRKLTRAVRDSLDEHSLDIFTIIPWFSNRRTYYFRTMDKEDFGKCLDKLEDIKYSEVQESSPDIIIRKNLIW